MLLQEARTDWLGSQNIFYNTRTNQISNNMNDLLDDKHIDFHPEGLRNYLEYGYSVFGQTIIEDIKILPANSRIYKQNGKLKIEYDSDPFDSILGKKSNVSDVLDHIRGLINSYEKKEKSQIIIPTSSGFDSRLIISMIEDRDNVEAYTYGISKNQEESIETVYAKKLCELLHIKWKQISLGNFGNYMDSWYDIYGGATHTHGMYQMEFYDLIRKYRGKTGCVISGIYGDLWAGNFKFDEIKGAQQLINLGITHGLCVDPNVCHLAETHELRDAFFVENKEKLKEQNWRIILAARIKVVLLSYLLRIPEFYGFKVWSPFMDVNLVGEILNLSWDIKEKRKWQVDYFRKKDILIGDMNLKCDRDNVLSIEGWRRRYLPALDEKLMSNLIDVDFLRAVNKEIRNISINNLPYYNAYLVLYPIQKLLVRKEYGESK